MKLGIVGLPNVGKSTLFNAITNAGAQSANYPFCTIEPNVGVVAVPDFRLDRLAQMYNPVKVTPATVEFVDIAGLVRGASKGEGLGNKFLSHIREVDAIVHVVRCFESNDIIHVDGSVDAKRDIETINLELILSDLEMVERRIDRTTKAMKGDKSLASEVAFFKRVKEALENEKPARSVDCDETEKALLDSACLLTGKKVIYACNMSEQDFTNGIDSNENYKAVCALAEAEGSEVLPICAGLEAEISSLSKEDKEISLPTLAFRRADLTCSSENAITCSALSHISRRDSRRSERGRLKREQRLRRPPEKFIPTLNAALSAQRSSPLKTSLNAARWPPQGKRGLSVPRARTML